MLGLFLTLVGIIVGNAIHSNRDFSAARAKAAAQAHEVAQVGPAKFALPGCTHVTFTPAPPNTTFVGPAPNKRCVFYTPNAQMFYSDPRFSFAHNATNLVIAAVALASLVGFVMGTGFIGAEWTAGTFPLLLTWEPRRMRVLLAKLAAVVVTFVVIGVVTTAILLASGWAIAATRGTTAGITATVWRELLWYSLRGLPLIALLTGAGAAIAGLTRHTAAALVGAIGYMVVFEIVVRRLHPEWIRWLLATNSGALLGGWVHLDATQRVPFGLSPGAGFVLHANRAGIYLAVLFLVVVATWAFVLLRQDVNEATA
jgi:hypothetical protein